MEDTLSETSRPDVHRGVAAATALLLVAIACGCAKPRDVTIPAIAGSQMMPDPDGCFLLVGDKTSFAGAREYLNGPGQYGTLTDLRQGQDWRRRIRSIRVGPRATVTLWTDEQLTGRSLTLPPGDLRNRLLPPFDKAVESIRIACTPPTI